MAFDKLIISSIVGVAKSGNRMDQALDSLKDKLIQTTATTIQKEIPIDLPFDVVDALQSRNLPTPSPSLLLTIKPIPEAIKQSISDTLDTLEATLDNTIKTKNQLKSSLDTLTKPLDTLQQLSTTLNGVLTGLSAAVKIIKAVSIPTSVPPGVGLPVSVINGFSSTLDTLQSVIDKTKGPLGVIPPTVRQINQLIIPIVNKLNLLDPVFGGMINLISFIRILLLFGPNATQQQIDSVLQETSSKITESLEATGPTSNSNDNLLFNQELLDRLNPNSNNPLFYKDFRLTLEYDPNNTYSFASRRVKGYKSEGNITLYNLDDEDGQNGADYSFASTPEVLVKEIQYKIDQYLSGERYQPIGFPGDTNGQRIGYKNKIYQWQEALDDWVEIPDPTFQAIVIRSKNKKAPIKLRRLEIYADEITSYGNIANENILPAYAISSETIFLNWNTKEEKPSKTEFYRVRVEKEGIDGFGQPTTFYSYELRSKETLPAKDIIIGSRYNPLNISTNDGERDKDNALLIPLSKSFNLNSISKIVLFNSSEDGSTPDDNINGFQIEFYASTNSIPPPFIRSGVGVFAPVFVIPITETLPRYDFIPERVRELQSL